MKCPAYNGRFGVMAAVAPQTILCGNERLYPAGSVVEAATTPSRWDVVCKRRERGRQSCGNRENSNVRHNFKYKVLIINKLKTSTMYRLIAKRK